jgi:hypothetical protein
MVEVCDISETWCHYEVVRCRCGHPDGLAVEDRAQAPAAVPELGIIPASRFGKILASSRVSIF